jgi:hypothetical protein
VLRDSFGRVNVIECDLGLDVEFGAFSWFLVWIPHVPIYCSLEDLEVTEIDKGQINAFAALRSLELEFSQFVVNFE